MISRELVRELLKPPIELVTISPGTLPEDAVIKYGKVFSSVDDAYAFLKQERPEGRWTLWLKGVDGQVIGVDSKGWEKEDKLEPGY
jgi:hypothetical protein